MALGRSSLFPAGGTFVETPVCPWTTGEAQFRNFTIDANGSRVRLPDGQLERVPDGEDPLTWSP